MRLYNVQNLQEEEVPNPEEAIRNRTHAPLKTQAFRYVDPSNGAVFETTGDKLHDRLSAGFKLETPESRLEFEKEKRFGDRPGLASTLGFARGASFGASDVLGAAIGFGDELAEIKARNPGASGVGEVGGIIIPALLSGGTTAAAKTLSFAPRMASGLGTVVAEKFVSHKVGKAAIRLAVEGSLYGLGKSTSEAALGEPSNVAENIIIGAVSGPILLGAGVGIGKVGKAALEKGIPSLGEKLFGANKSRLAQWLEWSDAGDALRAKGLAKADTVAEVRNEAVRLAGEAHKAGIESAFALKKTPFSTDGVVTSTELLNRYKELRGAFEETFLIMRNGKPAINGKRLDKILRNPELTENQEALQLFDDYLGIINSMDELAHARPASTKAVDALKNLKETAVAQQELANLPGSVAVPTGVFSRFQLPGPRLAVRGLQTARHVLKTVEEKWGKSATEMLEGLSGTSGKVAASVSSNVQAPTKEHVRELHKIFANQEQLSHIAETTANGMRLALPKVADDMLVRHMQILDFLASKIPEFEGVESILGGEPELADSSYFKFLRYYEAVSDPFRLLHEIKTGDVREETVETVRELYPNLYQKTTSLVAEYLAQNKPKLSYSRRLALEQALGIPLSDKPPLPVLQSTFAPAMPNTPSPKPMKPQPQLLPGEQVQER